MNGYGGSDGRIFGQHPIGKPHEPGAVDSRGPLLNSERSEIHPVVTGIEFRGHFIERLLFKTNGGDFCLAIELRAV